MLIYSQGPMEISIHIPAKVGGEGILFLWFGVLLVSISVHISKHFERRAKWVNVPYIWHQMQWIYIGQLDLFLVFYYWPNPKDNIETITKPIHQGIS